jgi:cytochrome c-type biogenesis protein CcmH/NrfG
VIHDHIYSPLPLPRDINPELNDEMQRALLKALAKKREDRYADIPEMMAAILKAFDLLIQQHPSPGEAPTLALDAEERRTASIERARVAQEAQITGEIASEPETEKKKSRIPGWIAWLLIPGLVLLCLTAGVISNANAVPGPDLITEETLAHEANLLSTLGGDEIQSLNQQIREEPENPYLRYQLGVAFLNAGRPQQAREAFIKALQYTENDPDIILQLGENFANDAIWTYAAYSFLKVEQLGSSPEELDQMIREALYYAAFEDFSVGVLTNNEEIIIDPALEQLMGARRALITGKNGLALEIVDQVMVQRPDLLEAYLLKIDILYDREQYEQAANLLVELQAREDLPEWIRQASKIEAETE